MRDPITSLLYGPQGPELIRAGTDHWGKYLEETVAGNDNENIIEKTKILGKHTFFASTILTIFDVTCFNHRGGATNVLQRMKYHYLPWLGGSVAYTATVSCMSSLRGGKTDQWNHFAGGLAVGTVIGRHTKSFQAGMISGVLLGIVGWYYKDSKMEGYELVPMNKTYYKKHGHPFTHKTDYTTNIFPEKPGYWARTEADVQKVFQRGQLSDGNSQNRIW